MTTINEHLQQARDHLQQAHDKAHDELGTQMMIQEVLDDLTGLINRYQRINDD